jgi:Kef-type K+ transport system membrane component KefB
LAIISIATVGKLGGTAMSARLTGMNWKDAFALGSLMNTRGLVELVALNIGYDLGILPPTIFTMMVLMSLVTTFLTGPLLSLIERVGPRAVPEIHASPLSNSEPWVHQEARSFAKENGNKIEYNP